MKRHNFKELLIWQLGMDIVDHVYVLTRKFPKEEKFGLGLQMRKAAISIPSNIAEGCGRGSDAQLAYFLDIAQGSAFELESQCYIAHRQQLASSELISTIIDKIKEGQKMIFGFKHKLSKT